VQSIRRGRRRRSMPLNAEINITNLVDVAFVLLIIFMITAPILQGGVELRLPDADAAPLTSGEGVIVSLQRDGAIYIDRVQVRLEEFPAQYRAYLGERQTRTVFLRADQDVAWGQVARLIATMEESGVGDVSVIYEPAVGGR
jgi:biopolymer transport protein TolR